MFWFNDSTRVGNVATKTQSVGSCALHLFTVESRKMASANFLEEALNTDVDESAVNAIVGSLENQLGTASPHTQQPPNAGLQQNHVNSAISNGGTASSAPQKHGTMANGDSISASVSNVADKQMNNSGYMNASAQSAITSTYSLDQKPPEGVKIVYTQGGQVMGAQGAVLQQRPPQGQIPNGTINMAPQTVCCCFVCILTLFCFTKDSGTLTQ